MTPVYPGFSATVLGCPDWAFEVRANHPACAWDSPLQGMPGRFWGHV